VKNNLTFYTHNADDHNSWQMKTLKRKYNWEGIGRFYALKGLIAQSPYCSMDITSTNKIKAIAAELDMSLREFNQYLEYLHKDCELLTIDNGIITEAGILDDLKRVNKKRENDRDQKSLKGVAFSPEIANDTPTKQELSLPKQEVSYTENEQIRLDKIRVEDNTEVNSIENTNVTTEKFVSVGADAPPKKKDDRAEKLEKKKNACLLRRAAFKEELRAMKDEFPTELLNEFYKYWSELNTTKTKMKWEMQQTWELSLRLAKWERNNQKYTTKNYQHLNGTNGNSTIKHNGVPAGAIIEADRKFGKL
jgi:hypothetical protein